MFALIGVTLGTLVAIGAVAVWHPLLGVFLAGVVLATISALFVDFKSEEPSR